MNRVDLLKKLGTVTAMAKAAEIDYLYFSKDVGFRVPPRFAEVISKNTGIKFSKSDYKPRKVEFNGDTYTSQPDVDTRRGFQTALKAREGLHFDFYGAMVPVEKVIESGGQTALLNAFRNHELFQKGG